MQDNVQKFEVSELLVGRPHYCLSDNEKDCYDILDNLKIEYERVDFNKIPEGEEDIKLIDNTIKVVGIKNLVFQNRNKSETYLIIMLRDKILDKREFANTYNTSRIAMVEDNVLKDILNTHKGAVSVTELIYDKENKVKLFIDEDVLKQDYMRFHPNNNRAIVRIKMEDFKNKLIPYLKHDINILKLNNDVDKD